MTFYLSGAGAYCVFLLCKMFGDQESSKTDPTSWMVIAIASVFWVIVIPLSILEIQTKNKAKARLDAIPKPINFGQEARHIKTVQQVEEAAKNITPLNSYQ